MAARRRHSNALKSAVAQLAFQKFKEGTPIEGASHYTIIQQDEVEMSLSVKTSDDRPARYFIISVKEPI